jgi:predicted DNA-binding transcriptional regulator AlpA
MRPARTRDMKRNALVSGFLCLGERPLRGKAMSEYLTTKHLLHRFAFSQMSFWRLRNDEKANFPKPVYVGKAMRWRRADVEQWELRTYGSTSALELGVA